MVLTYIRDSVLWAQALASFDDGRFEQARSYLTKIKGRRKESSEYLAILATVRIGLHESKDAREILLKAISGSEPTKPEYRTYVDLYCRYYLSSVDGDEGGKAKYLQAAMQADAPPIIRRWLPLSYAGAL